MVESTGTCAESSTCRTESMGCLAVSCPPCSVSRCRCAESARILPESSCIPTESAPACSVRTALFTESASGITRVSIRSSVSTPFPKVCAHAPCPKALPASNSEVKTEKTQNNACRLRRISLSYLSYAKLDLRLSPWTVPFGRPAWQGALAVVGPTPGKNSSPDPQAAPQSVPRSGVLAPCTCP